MQILKQRNKKVRIIKYQMGTQYKSSNIKCKVRNYQLCTLFQGLVLLWPSEWSQIILAGDNDKVHHSRIQLPWSIINSVNAVTGPNTPDVSVPIKQKEYTWFAPQGDEFSLDAYGCGFRKYTQNCRKKYRCNGGQGPQLASHGHCCSNPENPNLKKQKNE